MKPIDDYAEVADRFGAVAEQFCEVVDAASGMDRIELLTRIYRLLPNLIDEAIKLPKISTDDDDDESDELIQSKPRPSGRPNDEEWGQLYNLLKGKLGDWGGYWQVSDPTRDKAAIFGSLADDIADIYRDLKRGLLLKEAGQSSSEEIIWDWRLHYYFHWGQHAMDALRTIHFRLEDSLE